MFNGIKDFFFGDDSIQTKETKEEFKKEKKEDLEKETEEDWLQKRYN